MVHNAALRKTLECLGLTNKDIQAYLEIANRGKVSVTTLARVLEVERPTVYAVFERLQAIGLMPERNSMEDSKVCVEPPCVALRLLVDKTREMQIMEKKLTCDLPELMKQFDAISENPMVKVYSGNIMSGVELDGSETHKFLKGDHLILGNLDHYLGMSGLHKMQESAKKSEVCDFKVRILTIPTSKSLKSEFLKNKSTHQVRFLKNADSLESVVVIWDSHVLIGDPVIKKYVMIKDRSIEKFFRWIFESLWAL